MQFDPCSNLEKIRRLTFQLTSWPPETYKNVLIVDDSEDTRFLLRLQLSRKGYFVYEASNGKQAMEILTEHPIDAALIDYCMPEMDGLELLEKLKEYRIRKVLLTSYLPVCLQRWGGTASELCNKLGAIFAEKPFRMEYLEGVM